MSGFRCGFYAITKFCSFVFVEPHGTVNSAAFLGRCLGEEIVVAYHTFLRFSNPSR